MKKIITALAIIAAAVIPASPEETKGVYILCYHAIKEKKDPYSLSPATMSEEIKRLKEAGFTFVTFDDVKSGNITGVRNILVTIDDGNESVWDAYRRIMKPNGIKPVLGIYPAIIGRMKYALTWEQLKTLKEEGCYIAAHGYNHMYLSSKYYKENIVQFKKEIYLSKKVLEQRLNMNIDAMIYPFGVFSDEAVMHMKDAGYKYGFSLERHMARIPFTDPFNIPRYMLTKPSQKGTIALIIKKSGESENIASVTGSGKNDKKTIPAPQVKEKVTIKNYPVRLKKLMINDIVFMPESGTDSHEKKRETKSKILLKSSVKSKKTDRSKSKNIRYFPAKEHRKMTDRETKKDGEKHSFLLEVKAFYFTLLERSRSIFTAFKEVAWQRLEELRQKTATLFS